ncbi:MAG: transporter substrate-binding domain-containing protein [Ectothiorhodospiraceae bacterium]
MSRGLMALATTLLLAAATTVTAAPTPKMTLLTEELPPLNFTRDGRPAGLAVEMVEEIQRRLGRHEPIQVVPWARGYATALKKPNLALFSTARSAERENLFKWVGPVTNLNFVIYKRRSSPLQIETLADARRVGSIATYRNDVREQFLQERGFANLDSSSKLISGARKLLEGRVDLWIDSNISAPSVVKQLGRNPEEIEPVLTVHTDPIYIAMSRGTPDAVVRRWQRTLEAMARDGTYERIHRRWLPHATPPRQMSKLAPKESVRKAPLTVLTENLPPLNFLADGELRGVSVDIVRELLRRLGRDDEISVVPWVRGYRRTQKESNVALFTTVRTEKREPLFQWVGPIGHSTTVLYGRRGDHPRIGTLADARKVDSIGTYRDDADEQFLRNAGFTNLYSHRSPASIVRNLAAGRVSLWVTGRSNAPQVIRQAGLDAGRFEQVFTLRETDYYIAFSQTTPHDVVTLWQTTLDAMRRDGTVKRVHQRWLHYDEEASP